MGNERIGFCMRGYDARARAIFSVRSESEEDE